MTDHYHHHHHRERIIRLKPGEGLGHSAPPWPIAVCGLHTFFEGYELTGYIVDVFLHC